MKLKTHKGVAKRIKRTKSGKLKYRSCGTGHLLASKARKRKRQLRRKGTVSGPKQRKNIKRLLPYG